MTRNKEVYSFKKGEVMPLDRIYAVSGIGQGSWWQAVEGEDETPDGDIIITKDITITIIVEYRQ